MKTTLLLMFSLLVYSSYAQQPWRAKLFVHFLDSNNTLVTDTVWFGCDSLGDVGFQEGLDVLDTVVAANKVLGFDSLVQIQYKTNCVNVKQNVKAFDNAVLFTFYGLGKVRSISWDTTDFIYNDSIYKLRSAYLTVFNGYIDAIDVNTYVIYNDTRPINQFAADSVRVYTESTSNSECNKITNSFKFTLWVGMGYLDVGLPDLTFENVSFYPNPANDVLHLNFKKEVSGVLKLYNQLGEEKLFHPVVKQEQVELKLETIPGGLYFLTYSDLIHQVAFTKKIIIQH